MIPERSTCMLVSQTLITMALPAEPVWPISDHAAIKSAAMTTYCPFPTSLSLLSSWCPSRSLSHCCWWWWPLRLPGSKKEERSRLGTKPDPSRDRLVSCSVPPPKRISGLVESTRCIGLGVKRERGGGGGGGRPSKQEDSRYYMAGCQPKSWTSWPVTVLLILSFRFRNWITGRYIDFALCNTCFSLDSSDFVIGWMTRKMLPISLVYLTLLVLFRFGVFKMYSSCRCLCTLPE